MGDVAVKRGMIYTVTDTINAKRDISEVIDLLDPFETPVLDMVGKDSLSAPCTQTKHEWMTDRLYPRGGTLAAAHVAGSGSITLASSEGKYLTQDDLFLVDNIVFRADSGMPDADVIAVTVVGGTDAAIADGSAWRKTGHAAPEGGLSRAEMKKTSPELPYNYTQIFKDWALITGTMSVIQRYGYANERAYNEAKILKGLAMDFEQTIIYGVKSAVETTTSRKSTMGGLFQYVFLDGIADSRANVTNLAGADFTETVMNDVLQAQWEVGGQINFCMVNGTNKRRISDWGKPAIRTERTERTAGASIGAYVSDFGEVDIILNRNLRASDIIFGNKSQLGVGPLNGRQFSSKMLVPNGDFDWYEIMGEYTMEVRRPWIDFAWLYNTSTTY